MFNKPDSKLEKKETSPKDLKRYVQNLGQLNQIDQKSVFSNKKPIKIKVSPGMLNRMNNNKKLISGQSGVSSSLAAGLAAARTASRGAGVASAIGESNVSFYGMSDTSFSPRSSIMRNEES